MTGAICPNCWDGVHDECIGNGCYCDCQWEAEEIEDRAIECEHGLVRSMCEQCEQEEQ